MTKKEKATSPNTTSHLNKMLIIALMIAITTIAAFSCMKPEKTEAIPASNNPIEEVEDTEKTFCFFGLDNRNPAENGRSDAIMLIKLDSKNNDVRILSICRDTILDMDGLNKCNAAYIYGGPVYAVDVLEKNLDIKIDGYVSTDFMTMIDIIDALGGVTLELTSEEAGYTNRYIDEMNKLYKKNSSHVSAGTNDMDGVQTVGYARVRYTEGWDYKRTERQRQILDLMMEKYKTADQASKDAVMNIVLTQLYTNINDTDLTKLGNNMNNYGISATDGFPKYRSGKYIEGLGDCVIPETLEKNVEWLHQFLYDEENYTSPESVNKISDTISKK